MYLSRVKIVYSTGRIAFACGLFFLTLLFPSCGTVRSFRGDFSEDRRQRIEQSPNWQDGRFRNQEACNPDEEGWFSYSVSLLFSGGETRPSCPVPVVKTDLHSLGREKECAVWFGHASLFLQVGGVRYLVDPVLTNVWPQRMLLRPFKGTKRAFAPEDIPDIDVLLITHSHWDHLDYFTIRALKDRVGLFVCPLGVGAYLEHWGCPAGRIRELDWDERVDIAPGVTIRALPTVHNSRRFITQDKTLWMAALIETRDADRLHRVFISGDGGYGKHFAQIREHYGPIDLAVMENGQYNELFHTVHTRPEELLMEIDALAPRMVLPYHNAKYALAKHPWDEPMERLYESAKGKPYLLLTPRIGDLVDFASDTLPTAPWWREMDDHPAN